MTVYPESELQEQWDSLLTHVVFPRILPDEILSTFREQDLLIQMVEHLVQLKECLPLKTIEMFKRLEKVYNERNPDVITNEINKLSPGDTFIMFVRRQNCAIMIHRMADSDDDAIVATFPGCLHPSAIYKPGIDIEFNYPVQAIKVTFSKMLRSKHFAQQLCYLYEYLPIEKKKRDYVSNWLVTVLMNEHSRTASMEEFPVIKKKFRDELIGENKKNYFRRSSFYMCMKVFLQHNLTMQLDAETGKFLYKVVMLKFLVRLCDPYVVEECASFNIDLMSQMIAKLARRIEKLLHMKPETMTNEIEILYNDAICEAKETIEVIRGKINRQIELIHQEDEKRAKLPPLTDLNFESDVRQKMPKLQKYLIERQKVAYGKDDQSKFAVKTYQRHFKNMTQRPNFEKIDAMKNDVERRVYWIEFENLILYSIDMEADPWAPDELRAWSFGYASYAETNYKDDPLFISRMLLVRLKMIAILDELAIKEHEMFGEHKTGINPKIFEFLLLPERADMEIAFELENYFRHRNDSSLDPSLIDEKSVSEHSFSVKFAKQNAGMNYHREKFFELDEKNIEMKKKEWEQGRREAANLRTSAANMNCHFFVNRWGKSVHNRKCYRCEYTRQANAIKIEEYVRLLPKRDVQQFGIVFELSIPNTIACLRDTLFKFNAFFGSEVGFYNYYGGNIRNNWVNRHQISKYNQSTSECVALGSRIQRGTNQHHVDNEFEDFIVDNTSDCIFHAEGTQISGGISFEQLAVKMTKILTFKAQGDYVGLQWTLNTTQHTQNEVLSRQSNCPSNLSLAEYKNFGSLRADGHRLQLRKLYAMIETEALSFEQESVLSLIMQTLWQCGVSGDEQFIRESHIDFNEPTFCTAMIQLLNKFIAQQENNWRHPLKLVMATLIAVRVFEINDSDSVANEIVNLLRNIRTIAMDWISKIEAVINLQGNQNAHELRLKVIFASIAGGLTFFVHPLHKYYVRVFCDKLQKDDSEMTAAQFWLHFVITLKNSILLYENDEKKLPKKFAMFLRLIESTGVHLERILIDWIQLNENKMCGVIEKHWPKARSGSRFVEQYFFDNNPSIFGAEVLIDSVSHTVSIDIITGEFLVDGQSMSRLPSEITQDENYQSVFGNATMIAQPDGQGGFSSVQAFNNCIYEFRRVNQNNIVMERNSNGTEKELIPFQMLRDDFPFLLVRDYTHWWSKKDNHIEFRPRTSGQDQFSNESETVSGWI